MRERDGLCVESVSVASRASSGYGTDKSLNSISSNSVKPWQSNGYHGTDQTNETPIQEKQLNAESKLSENAVFLILFQLEALLIALERAQDEGIRTDLNRLDLRQYIQVLQRVAECTTKREENSEEGHESEAPEEEQGPSIIQKLKNLSQCSDEGEEQDEGEGAETLQANRALWVQLLTEQIEKSKCILKRVLSGDEHTNHPQLVLTLQQSLPDLLPFSWLVQSWNDMKNQIKTWQVDQWLEEDLVGLKINAEKHRLFLLALGEHSGWKKKLEQAVLHQAGLAQYLLRLEYNLADLDDDHYPNKLLIDQWIKINQNAIGLATFFKDKVPYNENQSRTDQAIEPGSDYQAAVKQAYERGLSDPGRFSSDSENGFICLATDLKDFTHFNQRPSQSCFTTHEVEMSGGEKFETVDGWNKHSSGYYAYTKTLTSLSSELLKNKHQKMNGFNIPSQPLIELAAKMLIDFVSKVDVTERIHINYASDPVLVEALWGVAQVLGLGDRLQNNTKYPNYSCVSSKPFSIFNSNVVDNQTFLSGIQESIHQDLELKEKVNAFCIQNRWYQQGMDQTLNEVFTPRNCNASDDRVSVDLEPSSVSADSRKSSKYESVQSLNEAMEESSIEEDLQRDLLYENIPLKLMSL